MRISRVAAVLAAIVGMLVGFAVPAGAAIPHQVLRSAGPAHATADATGSVAVTVKDWETGAVLEYGCVAAYTSSTSEVAQQCTPVAGTYTIAGLAPGDYRIRGFGGVPSWAGMAAWYGDADVIHVVAGETAEVTSYALPVRGITGKVTDPEGNPIAGVKVSVVNGIYPTWPPGTATTDATGRYVVKAPRAGYNTVTFTPPPGLAAESWPDSKVGNGQSVYVDFYWAVTGIDATLEVPGQIEGDIAAPPGLTADGDACVVVYAYPGGARIAESCGALGAAFEFADLKPATYALCVVDETRGHCSSSVGAWLGHALPFGPDESWHTSVLAEQTTTMGLSWGGTIDVHMELDNGEPLDGGCLTSPELEARGAVPDCEPSGGEFSFTVVKDFFGSATFRMTGAANASDAVTTSHLAVNGRHNASLELTVPAPGSANATVALARDDGLPITKGCVDAVIYRAAGWVKRASSCDVVDGAVMFRGLAPGKYSFVARDVPGSYAAVRYPSEVTSAAYPSEYVEIAAGDDSRVTIGLPTTQAVTGTVLDADGMPVEDALVELAPASGISSTARTDADGTFLVSGPVVPAKLLVAGANGTGQNWYGGSHAMVTAKAVGGPAAGRVVDLGTIAAPRQTTVAGTIVPPDNVDWSSACVLALDESIAREYSRDCGAVGDEFRLDGLAPGAYRLCVMAEGSAGTCTGTSSTGFIVQKPGGYVFSGSSASADIAFGGDVKVHAVVDDSPVMSGCADLLEGEVVVDTDCTVADGAFDLAIGHDSKLSWLTIHVRDVRGGEDGETSVQTVRGGAKATQRIDLFPWRTIRGTITRPAGFSDTRVCALATDLVSVFEQTCLEPGKSTYEIQVPNGSYYVRFSSDEAGLAYEWYNNASTLAAAKRVAFYDYMSTTANAKLEVAASIQGRVTLPGGGSASGGCVTAYSSDGAVASEGCVDASGNYRITNLPAGTYRLRMAGFAGYASTWHSGAVAFNRATPVALAAGGSKTVNPALAAAATLTGHITFADGPATGGCVRVWASDGARVGSTCTIEDGNYVIDDLPPGAFRVSFEGFEGAANSWVPGVNYWDAATPVTLTRGATTTADATLAQGGTIRGTFYTDFATVDYIVELYDEYGHLVQRVNPTKRPGAEEYESLPYLFGGVPAGKYKIAVLYPGGEMIASFRKADGQIARETVQMPVAGGWDVTGKNLSGGGTGSGFVVGTINAPSSFKSPTLCVVAVDYTGKAVASDCGPRGAAFALGGLANTTHRYAVTNGQVLTANQFKSFTGAIRWFGNTTSRSAAPMYYAFSGTTQYFPFWFYSDVTYKTTNFEAVQWIGDQGIYRPSSNYFRPESTLTRRDLAIYLYKSQGSPAVTLPSKSPFTDVPTTDAAYNALLWMRAQKIWTNSTFKPSSGVDKKTEALILYRAAGSPAVTLPSKNPYTDIKSSDPAYKAVTWANKYKIVPKTSSTKYGATSLVKRKYAAGSLYEWWWRYG